MYIVNIWKYSIIFLNTEAKNKQTAFTKTHIKPNCDGWSCLFTKLPSMYRQLQPANFTPLSRAQALHNMSHTLNPLPIVSEL